MISISEAGLLPLTTCCWLMSQKAGQVPTPDGTFMSISKYPNFCEKPCPAELTLDSSPPEARLRTPLETLIAPGFAPSYQRWLLHCVPEAALSLEVLLELNSSSNVRTIPEAVGLFGLTAILKILRSAKRY